MNVSVKMPPVRFSNELKLVVPTEPVLNSVRFQLLGAFAPTRLSLLPKSDQRLDRRETRQLRSRPRLQVHDNRTGQGTVVQCIDPSPAIDDAKPFRGIVENKSVAACPACQVLDCREVLNIETAGTAARETQVLAVLKPTRRSVPSPPSIPPLTRLSAVFSVNISARLPPVRFSNDEKLVEPIVPSIGTSNAPRVCRVGPDQNVLANAAAD